MYDASYSVHESRIGLRRRQRLADVSTSSLVEAGENRLILLEPSASSNEKNLVFLGEQA